MIHIEKNQTVPENEDLIVLSDSGDYNDNDLIECCNVEDPGFAVVSFPAAFIKYGGIINQFSDPKLLGEEILKIDPESTHTAASYVRMMKELEAQMNGGELESGSLGQIISEEKDNVEEKLGNEESYTEENEETEEEQEYSDTEESVDDNYLEDTDSGVSDITTSSEDITDVDTELIPDENTGSTSQETGDIVSYVRRKNNG